MFPRIEHPQANSFVTISLCEKIQVPTGTFGLIPEGEILNKLRHHFVESYSGIRRILFIGEASSSSYVFESCMK